MSQKTTLVFIEFQFERSFAKTLLNSLKGTQKSLPFRGDLTVY